MDTNTYALVLTGGVLPGRDPDTVWTELAAYFQIEPARFSGQLLPRAPLTIKESPVLAKLENLLTGIEAHGGEAEIVPLDGEAAVYALVGNIARGPLPRKFIEERVARGEWPRTLKIAPIGSSEWQPWVDAAAVAAPAGTAVAASAVAPEAGVAAIAPAAPKPAVMPAAEVAPATDAGGMSPSWGGGPLPPGPAIHAGFWRRCAAYVIDGILLAIAATIVEVVISGGSLAALAKGDVRAAIGGASLMMLVALVGSWLYFSLFESGKLQATPGKAAMNLKVVDDHGSRIGFGKATGRYFGKIVSSIPLEIGFMLAGWTARKQALHDLMAGTLVVFRGVQPTEPLPTIRPPMPWYGWVVNVLFVVAVVGGAFGYAALIAWLVSSGVDPNSLP